MDQNSSSVRAPAKHFNIGARTRIISSLMKHSGLSKEVAIKAFNNTRTQNPESWERLPLRETDDVSYLFCWERSPEGFDYWENIFEESLAFQNSQFSKNQEDSSK